MISHSQYRKFFRFNAMIEMGFNKPEPCEKCGNLLGPGDIYVSKDYLNCKSCDNPIAEE